MAAELSVVDITGPGGELAEPGWLARAEAVHRQLRDRLPQDYARRMLAVFACGGRMSVEGVPPQAMKVFRAARIDRLVRMTERE